MNFPIKHINLPEATLSMVERKHNCMIFRNPNTGWWILQCNYHDAVPVFHTLRMAYEGKEIRA